MKIITKMAKSASAKKWMFIFASLLSLALLQGDSAC